jgi:hypothetical protein
MLHGPTETRISNVQKALSVVEMLGCMERCWVSANHDGVETQSQCDTSSWFSYMSCWPSMLIFVPRMTTS